MYRNTSPIFDMPEFPTLRRVKPLPKRRRTSEGEVGIGDFDGIPGGTGVSNVGEDGAATFAPSMPGSLPSSLQLSMPGPDATTEELLAHADTLSSHMALQSYYMPMLGSVQELLRSTGSATTAGPEGGNAAVSSTGLSDLDANLSSFLVGGDEEDHGDGDDMEHLQQPGNTKKRKVPANTSRSHGGNDAGSGQSGGEDESTDRSIPTGRAEEAADATAPPSSATNNLSQRKGRMPAVTLAGLQHKETLKSRKRQLAAVLGALSHGDTLALDQALSANYSFTDDLKTSEPPKTRLSKRQGPRLARMGRHALRLRHPDKIGLAVGDFTFVCPSATADRLIATKEEVAMLRNRFEAELARQAAKAAKLAASNKSMASPAKGSRQKRSGGDRALQRARTTASAGGGKGGEQTAEFLDQALSSTKPRNGKKKKRSALANASNPHHLRNYVPSRLPHSGTGPDQTTNSNLLGPLPLRFLSAEIPPRRRKKTHSTQPMAQLTNPTDEWICAFCEYELFYGDDQDYRRAVRLRKKILRRRRRARERAAAAASGNSTAKVPEKGGSRDEEYDAGFEPPVDEFATVPKQTKWKGDPNKEKERAGEQASYG